MTDVSLFRLHALRAGYLFVAAGLAATIWPLLINQPPQWPLMNSVVCSMLAAASVISSMLEPPGLTGMSDEAQVCIDAGFRDN